MSLIILKLIKLQFPYLIQLFLVHKLFNFQNSNELLFHLRKREREREREREEIIKLEFVELILFVNPSWPPQTK